MNHSEWPNGSTVASSAARAPGDVVVQSSSSRAAADDADSNPRGGDGQLAKEARYVTEGKTPCA